MYKRLRVEHGAYGTGIYILPDAPLATSRLLMNSCCLAYVIHDAKLVERAHTPTEMVINHYCGRMCGVRPPLRHGLQPWISEPIS